MGIIDKMKESWNRRTTAEKVKLVLDAINEIGITFMTCTLASKCYKEDDSRLKKASINLAAFSLGSFAARVSDREINHYVDEFAYNWNRAKKEAEEAEHAE